MWFSRKLFVLHFLEYGQYSRILGIFNSLDKAIEALDLVTHGKDFHIHDRYNIYQAKRNYIDWDGIHENTLVMQDCTGFYISESVKRKYSRQRPLRRLDTINI